jgi:hypothetical protein
VPPTFLNKLSFSPELALRLATPGYQQAQKHRLTPARRPTSGATFSIGATHLLRLVPPTFLKKLPFSPELALRLDNPGYQQAQKHHLTPARGPTSGATFSIGATHLFEIQSHRYFSHLLLPKFDRRFGCFSGCRLLQ